MWSYGQINVVDSVGDVRGYYAFTEQVSSLDEVTEIADRTLGQSLSVRVEAELDFADPVTVKTVTGFDISLFPGVVGQLSQS